MKSLKLKLYQNLCNYRKEGSFRYVETYPLPTPSMIRGMVHSLLKLEEYKPLLVSIQGESRGVITNLQKVYKFDRPREENPYVVIIGESRKTATHGIMFVDLHVHMNLILHICFEDENENLLSDLLDRVQSEIVIVGRNEDFALVEEAKIVELKKVSNTYTKHNMYVKRENIIPEITQSTRYRLPFWYYKVSSFEETRVFHFVDVHYVPKQTELINAMEDSDGDVVCLLDGKST